MLARDPIKLIRVTDVKVIVESTTEVQLSQEYVEEFKEAPEVRQTEIVKYLVSKALNDKEVQVVQANAAEVLRRLRPSINVRSLTRDFDEQIWAG